MSHTLLGNKKCPHSESIQLQLAFLKLFIFKNFETTAFLPEKKF